MCNKPTSAVIVLLLTLNLPAAADAAASGAVPGGLVVFGDSLSDTGNKYAVRDMLSEPPYDTLNEFGVPADPYPSEDGVYFSNGPVWIEEVAAAVGLELDARARLLGGRAFGNYAWGGARARAPGVDDGNRHLGEQVASYLADVNHDVRPDTLHVIFIGGNDVVDALITLVTTGSFPDAVQGLALAAASIQENVTALVNAGARRFLILNVPNVGLIPAIGANGRPITTCFSVLLNRGGDLPIGCPAVTLPVSIDGIADSLEQGGAEVTRIDVFSFITAIAERSDGFGLDDTTGICVMPNVSPYVCDDPNRHLFWDGIHPTRVLHRLLASRVLNELGY